jgi:uncharacterized membrane protein
MLIDRFFQQSKSKEKMESTTTKHSESHVRSAVKAISWRILGTLDTIVISWLITGKIALALSIGGIELITKMVLYFFHERIWNSIKWGKQ